LLSPWHAQGDTKVASPAVTELGKAEPITKAASRAETGARCTAVNGLAVLTPRQRRSWRCRTYATLIGPLLPGFGGRFPPGYRGETPSVPCPRRARNFE